MSGFFENRKTWTTQQQLMERVGLETHCFGWSPTTIKDFQANSWCLWSGFL